MTIREETKADIASIRVINRASFNEAAEANLVDALRKNRKLVISLIAEERAEVIGHIAFSAITTEPLLQKDRIIGLGPIAVLPEKRNKGTGSMLVKNGLERATRLGYTHVVLLGGGYYHRFGFVPAQQYGIKSVYNAGDHFMILALTEATMPAKVMMMYESEFADAGC